MDENKVQNNVQTAAAHVYVIKCPCCDKDLELVCYSSGIHKILRACDFLNENHSVGVKVTPQLIEKEINHDDKLGDGWAHCSVANSNSRLEYNDMKQQKVQAKLGRIGFHNSSVFNVEKPKSEVNTYYNTNINNNNTRDNSKVWVKNEDWALNAADGWPKEPNDSHKTSFGFTGQKRMKSRSAVAKTLIHGSINDKKRSYNWKDTLSSDKKISGNELWHNSKAPQYKFDRKTETQRTTHLPMVVPDFPDYVPAMRKFNSCDGINEHVTDTPLRNDYLSMENLSVVSDYSPSETTDLSEDCWYPLFKRLANDQSWDTGILIAFHPPSKKPYIGIELFTPRYGRFCIPLTELEINDLKKCSVYQYRMVPDEGFEIKPGRPRLSFLHDLKLLSHNQIIVTVPAVVSFNTYSIDEMIARKESLLLWSDGIGFITFAATEVSNWNEKHNSNIFKPLDLVSVTLRSNWEEEILSDSISQNKWTVMNIESFKSSEAKHKEHCYPLEAYRFDDLRLQSKKNARGQFVLQSITYPNVTVVVQQSQSLVDIERLKSTDCLSAVIAPQFGVKQVPWKALIAGPVQRVVEATDDRLSFFIAKAVPIQNSLKPVHRSTVEFVKQYGKSLKA